MRSILNRFPRGLFWSIPIGVGLVFSSSLVLGEELFKATFRVFNPVEDTREIFFRTDDQDREIRASFNGPSRRYQYEGPNAELVFYRIEKLNSANENGDEEEAIKRTPVGRVSLPATEGEYLILKLPSRGRNGKEYNLWAMEESMDRFPQGSSRIFNLSAAPVAMQFGSAQFVVGPGEQYTMDNRDAGLSSRGSRVQARERETSVRVGVSIDDEWRVIYRSIWHVSREARHQIFIVPSELGTVRVVHTADSPASGSDQERR